jgi:hypothetical protein
MSELAPSELLRLSGGDFWGGVGCGLGLVTVFFVAVSPDPFSKIALVTYGGTAVACLTAF